MGHSPNVTGLDWFFESVWPQVHKRLPELEFVIVGSKMTDEMRARWAKIDGVIVRGYVENLGEAYAAATAVVVPILTGGGTCVKLVEALSYGKKVLATPFGARGLSVRQIEAAQISIFETAAEFGDELKKFLSGGDNLASRVFVDAQSMVKRDYAEGFFNQQVENLLVR